MRSVTEFSNAAIAKGLKAREALVTEGKSPEEIQTTMGTTFKMEGDKLKFFLSALDIGSKNMNNLARVMVVALNEGEQAPANAEKVEEHYFICDLIKTDKPAAKAEPHKRGGPGGGKGGQRGDRPKSSPWGLSPEEKAAKKGGGAKKPEAKSEGQ